MGPTTLSCGRAPLGGANGLLASPQTGLIGTRRAGDWMDLKGKGFQEKLTDGLKLKPPKSALGQKLTLARVIGMSASTRQRTSSAPLP